MVKCPYCHFDNEDGALFCEQCKSDLAGIPAPVPAAHAAPEVVPEALPAVEPYHLLPEPVPAFPAAEPMIAEAVVEAVPVEAVPVEAGHVIEAVPVAAEDPIPALAPEPAADQDEAHHPHAVPTGQHEAQPAPAVAAPPAAAGVLPPGSEPRLLVLRGQKRNVEYPLYEGLNFIGRADEKPVDIDLEDQEPPDRVWCSRQHACISFENDALEIEDLNSSNGTFVNRTRVYPGQKRPLAVNDIVQIGNVQMKVVV